MNAYIYAGRVVISASHSPSIAKEPLPAGRK